MIVCNTYDEARMVAINAWSDCDCCLKSVEVFYDSAKKKWYVIRKSYNEETCPQLFCDE